MSPRADVGRVGEPLQLVDHGPNNHGRHQPAPGFVTAEDPLTQVDGAGVDQRSTDIAAVIQEIVNGSAWSSGKALALIVTGSGKRVAESWDGVPGAAPLLHVEYRVP